METSTNIFYKIFQIMNHYENVLENITYKGEKYKPDDTFNDFMNADEFFSSIFKEVPIKKKEQPPDSHPNENDDSQDKPANDNEAPSDNQSTGEDELPPDESKPLSKQEQIITKYIKKCYRIIVLKCHPDKNKSHENGSELFMKCQQYYECDFLIGILYVFYLYKLKPPPPLVNNTQDVPDDDYTTIVNRILLEIRVIQDKLVLFNSPIYDESHES